MAHAIRFEKTGGPEVLAWQEIAVSKPAQGQVRLRHSAVGLNFVDTYQRSGLYSLPLPSGLGSEAAGVVVLVKPYIADQRRIAIVQFPGGYIAEIHSISQH